MLLPTLAHVNEFGETVMLKIPHASDEPLFTWAAVIVAFPEAFRLTDMFWQRATGGTLSTTVTVDVQVETFPLLSVTVNVTMFDPILAQVNVVGEIESDAIPHASFDPLLTCVAVIEVVPEAFSGTVIFLQSAVGGTLSTTVTVAVQVETFPLLSVTVNVTVFEPILAHVNVDGETESEAIPQASFDPLFTCAAVIEAVPAAFRFTVTFLQRAVGGVLSITVTVAEQVDELPLLSVTVKITLLVPTFAQVKELGETESEAIPQTSELPLLICAAVMVALPAAFRLTEIF